MRVRGARAALCAHAGQSSAWRQLAGAVIATQKRPAASSAPLERGRRLKVVCREQTDGQQQQQFARLVTALPRAPRRRCSDPAYRSCVAAACVVRGGVERAVASRAGTPTFCCARRVCARPAQKGPTRSLQTHTHAHTHEYDAPNPCALRAHHLQPRTRKNTHAHTHIARCAARARGALSRPQHPTHGARGLGAGAQGRPAAPH